MTNIVLNKRIFQSVTMAIALSGCLLSYSATKLTATQIVARKGNVSKSANLSSFSVPSLPSQSASTVASTTYIERSATITLKIAKFDDALIKAENIASESGSSMLDSKIYVDGKGRKHGWVTMQVPASSFDNLCIKLQGLGLLYSSSTSANDRTSEYERSGRGANELQLHQERLQSVLTSNRRLRGSDILFLQDKMFTAGSDQEDDLQQQSDIERQSKYSTITLQLFEPYTFPGNAHSIPESPIIRFKNSFGYAHSQFAQLIDRGATASAYVTQYAFIWAPILIVSMILLRIIWIKRRQIISTIIQFGQKLLEYAMAFIGCLIRAYQWLVKTKLEIRKQAETSDQV